MNLSTQEKIQNLLQIQRKVDSEFHILLTFSHIIEEEQQQENLQDKFSNMVLTGQRKNLSSKQSKLLLS